VQYANRGGSDIDSLESNRCEARNSSPSILLKHVQRFGGSASSEIKSLARSSAQRILSPAEASGAAATDRAPSLFHVRVALAQIPKETGRRAGQLAGDVRLHLIVSWKLGAIIATGLLVAM
jgi:hypothetical protein